MREVSFEGGVRILLEYFFLILELVCVSGRSGVRGVFIDNIFLLGFGR